MKKDLQNSIDSYQELIKIKQYYRKKISKNSKNINEKTKKKLINIIKVKKMQNKLN